VGILFPLISLFSKDKGLKKQTAKIMTLLSVDNDTRIDVNNLDMFVTNHGSIAQDITGGVLNSGGLFFPKGSLKTTVFAAGLSVGAMVDGQLLMAKSKFSDECEFGPGIMEDGVPANPDDPRFRVYKITTGDGPGTLDWDDWPIADGAPIDEGGNPLLLGDQTLWAVFNDADPSLHIGWMGTPEPLGIEVQLTVLAYRWPNTLANTIFLKYRIINKGSNLLEDTYLYFWSDPDLGGPPEGFTDDFIGFDTDLELGYCYNSSNLDEMYQVAPPTVGFMMLQGPEADGGGGLDVTAFHTYNADVWLRYETLVYNVMQGLNSDGSQIINPITGLPTTFMFDGDPVMGTGWLDDVPADKRCALSSGPFTMAPDDTREVIYAIIIGQGEDRLNSIEKLRAMVPEVEAAYNLGFPEPDPPTSDAAAVTIDQPPNGCNLQSLVPSGTVAHLGSGTESFNVEYNINMGGVPEYQSFRTTSTLSPGQTEQIDFDAWTPSLPGTFDVEVITSLAGDTYDSNDILRAQIEITFAFDLQLISRAENEAILGWTTLPESDGIAGYNIYRSSTSGGPYTQLNSTLITDLTYMDNTIPSEIVYYVVTLELTNGMESEFSSELPVYPQTVVADSGILLVNGVDWSTYGQEIEDFYNTPMAGILPFDFWDLFTDNPVGLPPLDEAKAPPPELFFQYKTVIWIGNNWSGDLPFWFESLPAIKQYMLSGGNLLLATRIASTFFDNVLGTSYVHIDSWSGNVTIGESNPLAAIVLGLVDMGPGNGSTESTSANMFITSSNTLPGNISAFTPIFDWNDLEGTIWKGGFRSELASGGQFVFISGRPYRFDQEASQTNYDYILTNWFGHLPPLPDSPVEAIEMLITIVENLDLHHGLENSLVSKLKNAIKSLQKSHHNAAINELNAFINHVEAQSGKKISEKDADNLILYAQSIINAIQDGLGKNAGELNPEIDNLAVPKEFALHQNYPNPFNPMTTIKYSLPEPQYVTLKVYDMQGREVETLIDEQKDAGFHSVTFNGGRLSSGVYFYRLITEKFTEIKKLLLLK